MRARTLIPALAVVVAFVPMAASAAVPEPFIYSSQLIGMPPIPGTLYGTLQSAVRAEDAPTLRVLVHSVYNPMPTLTADLSALGFSAVATTSGTWIGYGAQYYPGYEYDFGPLTISANISDGAKNIPLVATDASGNTATSSARIIVDNALPTVALTSITFSTTSPNDGDYLYLSGRIDGTGSKAKAANVLLSLTDASGRPVMSTVLGGSMIYYGAEGINDALATSTDGSFSGVPIKLIAFGDKNWFPRADNLSIKVFVYDEAGNTASTTLTVPLHPPPPPPPAPPKVSNVLFLPGTQASRLYMKNGIGQERQLWEPSIWTDIPELAMSADGTSVNTIYTKDIVTDLYDNTLLGGKIKAALGDRTEVYGDFARFMDGLVASTTLGIKAWRAYPYDWRYDVRDIVNQGTLTEQPDGSLTRVYLGDVLNQLASSSATGAVTIIAHSNGGLLAKALMSKLTVEGKEGEVDQLIMIGTPQWGTPVAVGSMLHGDNQNFGAGLIAYAPEVRAAAATMPDLYALLPSKRYFERIAEPVATFKNQGMSAPFYNAFPNGIASFAYLSEFVTNALGLNVIIKDRSPLNIPLALSPGLLADAEATHDILDNWAPPTGLKVSAIAGWGQLTVYSYEYSEYVGHKFCLNVFQGFSCKAEPSFLHTPRLTEDGDGTVVSPSAVGDTATTWYFNAADYVNSAKISVVHRALTSAQPLHALLESLIKEATPFNNPFISTTKPIASKGPLTIISAYSPVNLLITSTTGEKTGIIPLPEIEGIYFASQDIPDSAVVTSGEEKFVYLPAGSAYSITATGYASGPATIEISQVDALGETTATTAIADIPVTASTTISLSIDATGAPSATAIDFDDDDMTDITITPMVGTTTSFAAIVDPLDYVAYMQRVTAVMALNKPIANELQAKLATIERTLEGRDLGKKGSRKSVEKMLDTLAFHVTKHTVVPAKRNAQSGISLTDAVHILDMISVLRSLISHL
ncbi:MAG: hypothetical protein Q7S95_00305 [bacterium]|nr:hypothetical protein [bacterium]